MYSTVVRRVWWRRSVNGRGLNVEEVRDHPWLVGWQSVGEMMKIVKEMKAE